MGIHYKLVSWFTPDEPDPKFVAKCRKEVQNMFNLLTGSSRKWLIQYLKDDKGNRVGVFVAYLDKDGFSIKVGWSMLNTEKDRWNKYVGLFHAFRRSLYDYSEDLPARVYDEIGDFYIRCTRYFLKNTPKAV